MLLQQWSTSGIGFSVLLCALLLLRVLLLCALLSGSSDCCWSISIVSCCSCDAESTLCYWAGALGACLLPTSRCHPLVPPTQLQCVSCCTLPQRFLYGWLTTLNRMRRQPTINVVSLHNHQCSSEVLQNWGTFNQNHIPGDCVEDCVDTEEMMAGISLERKADLILSIQSLRRKDRCTKYQLLSLVGRLSFVCKVIPVGRIFLRRLLDFSCKLWVGHPISWRATGLHSHQWLCTQLVGAYWAGHWIQVH